MWNKIQRIYVGENQVYPVAKYSYDFRGKTKTQAQSDGWTIGSWSSIDANWLGSTQWSANIINFPFSITNSRKLVFTCWFYNSNNSNKSVWFLWNSGTSSNTLMYLWSSWDGRWTAQINWTEVQWLTSKSSPSWQSEGVLTLDFVNLTWKFVYYWTTMNWTFTQTAADNMRTNLYAIRLFVQYSDGKIQYVKLDSYD